MKKYCKLDISRPIERITQDSNIKNNIMTGANYSDDCGYATSYSLSISLGSKLVKGRTPGFFGKEYSYEQMKMVPVVVERLGASLAVDIITGTEFQLYCGNSMDMITFSAGSEIEAKRLAEILKGLSEKEIEKYRESLESFKKIVDEQNNAVRDEEKSVDDYITQFRKKYTK